MKHPVLTLLFLSTLLAGRARAWTIPLDECGTMVQGVTCPLMFQDSQGRLWLLDQTGGFGLGSQVHVIGAADPGCFSICGQGGCVAVTSIGPCGSNPGVEYCFGDGTGTACPCGSGSAGNGCPNASFAAGAHMVGSGQASIANDTLVLNGTHTIPFGPGLYFQGDTQLPAGSLFGNGLLCTSGTTNRLEIRFADSAGASATTVVIHAQGAANAGDVRYYQLWYRDGTGFCTGAGFNLSNATQLTWTP